MRVDYVRRKTDIQQRRIGRYRSGVLVLIAVRGHEMRAIRHAIDSYFATGAAAHGANRFAFRRAEAIRFSFFADGTSHDSLRERGAIGQNTCIGGRIKEKGNRRN